LVNSDLPYWVAFNRTKGVGPLRLRALIAHFGDVRTAWHAETGALRAAHVLDERTLASLLTTRATINLEAELDRLDALGIYVLTLDDPAYPLLLRTLTDAPPVLYVRGTLLERDQMALAVVGTREATAYGKLATQRLVTDLAASGLTIVSGLALGIDVTAHRAALEAGGRTVAVMACGLDRVYPPRHEQIAERILRSGAMISEMPLGEPAERGHFNARNRIISGLCLGVLVVEAGEKSGALITAGYALDQGREVFAVPGNLQSLTSQGTNRLIQNGAKMVMGAADVLDEVERTWQTLTAGDPIKARLATVVRAGRVAMLHQLRQWGVPPPPSDAISNAPTRTARGAATERLPLPALTDNPDEARVLLELEAAPMQLDELGVALAMPIGQLSAMLSIMTLRGWVQEVGIQQYALSHPPQPQG
jgi:DNA processing protein